MGKKSNVSTEAAANSAQNTAYSPEYRARKAMFLLNEYMCYFSSVNGLFRQMVDVQKEVLCRIGRSAWNRMTQEELDKVLNRHFVNNNVGQNMQLTTDLNDTCESEDSLFQKPKMKPKSRRDSLQSITEYDGQDGFSGPFTWRTRSLQDLSFPSTPEVEIKAKKKQINAASKESDENESAQEDDVIPSVTLDELQQELKRNYEQAKAARLKMQQMASPVSKKPPEGITKSAVNAKLGSTRLASVSSAKRPELNGIPLSPADLKPVSALKPISQERLKTSPSANGSHMGQIQQFHFRSPPEPLPRPKTHSRSDSTEKIIHRDSRDTNDWESDHFGKRTQSTGSYSGKSPRHGSFSGKSPRHDSLSSKSGKSSGHESVSGSSGISPRRDSISKSSRSRSGSFSKKATSPDKISVKEISEDLNQFFAAKTHQSPNGTGDTDMLMDLFKNW